MSKLLRVVAILTIGINLGCSENTKDSVTRFVHPDVSIVSEVLTKRVNCMHCPTYFRFKMGTANQAVLLDYQGMEKITKPTAHMEAVLGLPDAEWWPREYEIASMDKYWVEYEYPYENSSEPPMFRMALISGETVFFMAKGGNWIVEKDRK